MMEALKPSRDIVEESGRQKPNRLLCPKKKNRYKRREPNWVEVYKQITRKHQTLIEQWEKYRRVNRFDSYSYAQFTDRYRRFLRTGEVPLLHKPYSPGRTRSVTCLCVKAGNKKINRRVS